VTCCGYKEAVEWLESRYEGRQKPTKMTDGRSHGKEMVVFFFSDYEVCVSLNNTQSSKSQPMGKSPDLSVF
jgi:hypothetical protein